MAGNPKEATKAFQEAGAKAATITDPAMKRAAEAGALMGEASALSARTQEGNAPEKMAAAKALREVRLKAEAPDGFLGELQDTPSSPSELAEGSEVVAASSLRVVAAEHLGREFVLGVRGALSASRRNLELLVERLHDLDRPGSRSTWGVAGIGRHQFPLAEAFIEVEAANLMRWKACELIDAHKPCGAEANMAKLLAAKASWEAANACLQTHGGFGFAAEYDVERKFRETRLYQVAPISTNMVFSYIAEHVLGLPKSY